MNDKLFAALQYIAPQHGLSRVAGWLASSELTLIKNTFIRWFANRYDVDMAEARLEDPLAYPSFNEFFTRALKPGARPVDPAPGIIACPADGSVSQIGQIADGRIFQAKGQTYTTAELLGGDESLAEQFNGGAFATIYLSPKDYHRVHMPLTGTLTRMSVIPGDLFSVNDATARAVPRLFSRNERAVTVFDTEAGPMAVVLVGAMIVAGIETVWAGEVAPFKRRTVTTRYNQTQEVALTTGDELGRFKLGSTAIVLFGPNQIAWDSRFEAGTTTRMGETLGRVIG